jgi:hypothetical protein
VTRKALIVGIDHYEAVPSLHGCVNDAHAVKAVLDRHADGTTNFDTRIITGTGPGEPIGRAFMKDAIRELFAGKEDTVLLYFAGHGHVEATGGYLCTSDSQSGDDGIPLTEILTLANKSRAGNKVIILDSCHSGVAGTNPDSGSAVLAEGMTILTASAADQYATESDGSGTFTTLLVDALNGAASNLVGDVTPGSVYAHIDQSLGRWGQRPIFRTNVESFVSLRKVNPPIDLEVLRRIAELFPSPSYEYFLDPSYEPEGPCPDEVNTKIFSILQKFNRVNLLVPVDTPHMYHAAMESKSCKLTVLGEHYRRLVERGRI